MIISIDGVIGSGKTTLTSLLALHFKGVDFKYSPPEYEEPSTPVTDFVSEYYQHRESLKKLVKVYDKNRYVSNIMLLHSLIRNMLIRSSDAGKYIFVDSFWDPFWHFESKHYDEFFPVIHKCVPLPDISLFLDVSANRSIRRATMRDPKTEHTADADSIQGKMNAFKKWARKNISNFYLIRANIPVSEVLQQAITIIEGQKNE